jgi:DeoR/GlpR family transcriptional regulator of sugar metabolism
MPGESRRNQLLELVRSNGFASLPELAEQLDVSESTIRRDLEFLEQQGAIRRTHGGVFYTGTAPKLPHFEERQPAQWDKKQAIAQAAVQLIEDGDTLLLDGGSTTYEVARLLGDRRLQIVTNSLPVANLFATKPQADLVIVGGYVYPRTGVALGPYANATLATINVRRNRTGDDARRRRSDGRGRQHQIRSYQPGPSLSARSDRRAGRRRRIEQDLARKDQGCRSSPDRCRQANFRTSYR